MDQDEGVSFTDPLVGDPEPAHLDKLHHGTVAGSSRRVAYPDALGPQLRCPGTSGQVSYHATAKAEPTPPPARPLTFHGEVTAGRTGRVVLGPGGYSITLGHAWTGATLTVELLHVEV